MQFDANMSCPVCHKITRHHIEYWKVIHDSRILTQLTSIKGIDWREQLDVTQVLFSRLCLNTLGTETVLVNGRLKTVGKYCLYMKEDRFEYIPREDWNALIKLGREDYPEYFGEPE